jgi:putative ABC transport system ATP-binding protein
LNLKSFDLPSFEWDAARPLIEMKDVGKLFKTAIGEVEVLKGIHVDIHQGEFVSVVGRSGSGKSTLANMITGIDHPSSGTVSVAGTVLNRMPESRMAVWRGRKLGIVFQFFQLMPMLTLLENIMLPMDLANLYAPAERETRAMDLLARVGLETLAHKLPGVVSGGQQQSAAIARALANDPPVLIADEPTGNLDEKSAENAMQLFEEQVANQKTILMVTHDAVLARRTQRSLIISDGELVPEAVSSALPDLPHAQMLKLGRTARSQSALPHAPLVLPGTPDASVYVVRQGQVVIYPRGQKSTRAADVHTLISGSIFCQEHLRRDYGSTVEVYSSDQPVELLVLEAEAAALLLHEAPLAQKNNPGIFGGFRPEARRK